MIRSLYYQTFDDHSVQCGLCPHRCVIGNHERGICKVRINKDGHLYSEDYERITAIHLDPVEKKPLYHFYPGAKILSIGSMGCTFKCLFCQNYEISQAQPKNNTHYSSYPPDAIVKLALEQPENIGIAFTYNEPVTFFEYMLSVAGLSIKQDLKTVMVTNGFINKKPLENLITCIDAFNVDLKAFSDSFYQLVTQSKLEPVKKTIKRIADAKKHLEITNLVIPGLNDNIDEFEEMVRWIAGETGNTTVLHISRYFPNYQMNIGSTPIQLLNDLYNIAKKHLKYVYLGNVPDIEKNTTHCNFCGNKLIVREPNRPVSIFSDKKGRCPRCGNQVLDFIGLTTDPGKCL